MIYLWNQNVSWLLLTVDYRRIEVPAIIIVRATTHTTSKLASTQ